MTATELITKLTAIREDASDERTFFAIDQVIRDIEDQELIEDRTEYRNI